MPNHDKRDLPFSSRRQFIGQSASLVGGAALTPYIFTSMVRADDKPSQAPSDRIRVGSIGVGGRGSGIMNQANHHGSVVAVADVDAGHARRAANHIGENTHVYEDYRRILDRQDIDAVTIGTPDHWHTKIAIEALQAGKDIYCEKPLTLTIEEGKQICQVAKDSGRVFQVGTQQRSEMGQRFLQAIAIIRAGRIGTVNKVSCAIGAAETSPTIPQAGVPSALNWEMWLGQAPFAEYRSLARKNRHPHSRCHAQFRWWYEYSGGKMTDWGAHHVDIATWALGLENTGPSEVRVVTSKHPTPFKDGYPTQDDRYNTAHEFLVVAQFPEVEMTIRHDTDNGVLFEGTKGRLFVNRGKISGKPVEELADNPLPENAIAEVYKGKQPNSHMGNFFDCLKTRDEPISDVFSHHRMLTTCHLANIALRLNRDLKWDPVAEKIVGDDEAQSFVSRKQRQGYEIVV